MFARTGQRERVIGHWRRDIILTATITGHNHTFHRYIPNGRFAPPFRRYARRIRMQERSWGSGRKKTGPLEHIILWTYVCRCNVTYVIHNRLPRVLFLHSEGRQSASSILNVRPIKWLSGWLVGWLVITRYGLFGQEHTYIDKCK